MNQENPDKSGIIRDDKGRFPKGVSGNPLGKPEGTVSLVSDIKNRLIWIKEHQPEKYQGIIDDYWMDKNKRELLIKIVEPQALSPQTQVAVQINNYAFTKEEVLDEAYELVAKDKNLTLEELERRLDGTSSL